MDTTSSNAQRMLGFVQSARRARDAQQFKEGLREGFDGLRNVLLNKQAGEEQAVADLELALSSSVGGMRERQLLELCSWPIFDKPSLPIEFTNTPEFLWLFCLPFVVQFSQETAVRPIIPRESLDSLQLHEALYSSHRLNPHTILSPFSSLVTREDLQRIGPVDLATRFVKQELNLGPVDLVSKGVQLDSEVESARVVTLYLVGAARLPTEGTQHLFEQATPWVPGGLEQLALASLTEQGYSVESVSSLPPCSMAETLLRCTSGGTGELFQVLALAKEHYAIETIYLEHPAEGWAEIHSRIKGEAESILVLPAFPFVEPPKELQGAIRQCCESLGLAYDGAFSVAGPTSVMLQ